MRGFSATDGHVQIASCGRSSGRRCSPWRRTRAIGRPPVSRSLTAWRWAASSSSGPRGRRPDHRPQAEADHRDHRAPGRLAAIRDVLIPANSAACRRRLEARGVAAPFHAGQTRKSNTADPIRLPSADVAQVEQSLALIVVKFIGKKRLQLSSALFGLHRLGDPFPKLHHLHVAPPTSDPFPMRLRFGRQLIDQSSQSRSARLLVLQFTMKDAQVHASRVDFFRRGSPTRPAAFRTDQKSTSTRVGNRKDLFAKLGLFIRRQLACRTFSRRKDCRTRLICSSVVFKLLRSSRAPPDRRLEL